MKRELKLGIGQHAIGNPLQHCRAYPDEKGIETINHSVYGVRSVSNCRAYPDEKGIETIQVVR